MEVEDLLDSIGAVKLRDLGAGRKFLLVELGGDAVGLPVLLQLLLFLARIVLRTEVVAESKSLLERTQSDVRALRELGMVLVSLSLLELIEERTLVGNVEFVDLGQGVVGLLPALLHYFCVVRLCLV